MLLTNIYLVSKTKSGRILYGAGFYYMEKSTMNILQKWSCIWNNIKLSELFFRLWMNQWFSLQGTPFSRQYLKVTSVLMTKLLIFKLLFTESRSGDILKKNHKFIKIIKLHFSNN